MHFLCICTSLEPTHSKYTHARSRAREISLITHYASFSLAFEAGDEQQAHCENVEMHACDACVRACVCVSALNFYFDPPKSMFEAAIEIQASNRLSCW